MEHEYIEPVFNARYPKPSEQIRRKLYLSWKEAQKTENRNMRCPVCGLTVAVIPKNQTAIQNVRCRKCKFTGPLSPAYFRTMKGYCNRTAFLKERTFIR